jgi:hypothetical protein
MGEIQESGIAVTASHFCSGSSQVNFAGETMTSIEAAAWVQAVFSVVAIGATGGIAIWQSKSQHESAMRLQREEHKYDRVELTKTLLQLSRNCQRLFAHIIKVFDRDRTNVHDIAEGRKPDPSGQLNQVESAVTSIPLHDLPQSLVTVAMLLSGTVLEFRNKVAMALKYHRTMDASAFDDLFRSLDEMDRSLGLTCADIEEELRGIEASS